MRQHIAPSQVKSEKLPPDYILPDDPVDHIAQPALAAALSDSLETAGYLGETAFTCTNYGLCAVVDGKMVVKAPDWAYVAQNWVSRETIARSYTPNLDGEIPTRERDRAERFAAQLRAMGIEPEDYLN